MRSSPNHHHPSSRGGRAQPHTFFPRPHGREMGECVVVTRAETNNNLPHSACPSVRLIGLRAGDENSSRHGPRRQRLHTHPHHLCATRTCAAAEGKPSSFSSRCRPFLQTPLCSITHQTNPLSTQYPQPLAPSRLTRCITASTSKIPPDTSSPTTRAREMFFDLVSDASCISCECRQPAALRRLLDRCR